MDNKLKLRCYNNAYKLFGRELPNTVESRLSRELELIIKNGYTSQYFNAQRIVRYSEKLGYPALPLGAEGSSLAAYLLGITSIDPLPPHYRCPKCCRSEFVLDGTPRSGFELSPKVCPDCGEKMTRSGHYIPFEPFLGTNGEKPPHFVFDISDKILDRVRNYTAELLGEEPPIKISVSPLP